MNKNTLYSFTYNYKDYFLYNDAYYERNSNKEFTETCNTVDLSKSKDLRIACNDLYKQFLHDLTKINLLKYRVVKYRGYYYYFDHFTDLQRQYCDLILIDKSLIHLSGIDVNHLIIIGNNNDEAIRESKLMLFELFRLANGDDFDISYLPKSNQWYKIRYYIDKKDNIHEMSFFLAKDYIINSEYIIPSMSCYQNFRQIINNVLIPIKNLLCIYQEKQTDVENKNIEENGFDTVIQKGDFILTNDNQYCIYDRYIGSNNFLVQTITKSFETKQINLSDIKRRVLDKDAILSCMQIYDIQKYIEDNDKGFKFRLPQANKLYRIKFYNDPKYRDEVYYGYGININKINKRIHMPYAWSMNLMDYFNDVQYYVNDLRYIEEASIYEIPTEFKKILTKKQYNIIL